MELYQRIEQLIGKKLPLYTTVEEEVLLLMERVTEAQRYAKMVRKIRINLPYNKWKVLGRARNQLCPSLTLPGYCCFIKTGRQL